MRRAFVLFCAVLVALFSARFASAHGLRSAFLEIEELAPGSASVHLRVTKAGEIVPRSDCTLKERSNEDNASNAPLGTDRAFSMTCPDGTLSGHEVSIDGLGTDVDDGVVWLQSLSGKTISHVLTARSPAFTIPRGESSALQTAREYVGLGIVHIATGYDHLLFLALLALSVRRLRPILWAETAFTLSHSISFSATALGWIRVSQSAAECCIALSLVLLAIDAKQQPSDSTPTRRIAGLAFVFGLVHGLGFAGGLREIGVPEHDVAAALVGFAGGVEIGQVAFLLALVGILHLAERARFFARATSIGTWSAGAIAAYWLILRLHQLLP